MVSVTGDNPPPSYSSRVNFSLISLQTSANRLEEDREPVLGGETIRVGECHEMSRSRI